MTDSMLPPWKQYPHIPRFSIGWRMGYGESYYIKFLRWYRSLSKVDAEAYARKNPEFEEWIGFYDQLLHKTRPSDDVLRIAAEKIRKLHNRSE